MVENIIKKKYGGKGVAKNSCIAISTGHADAYKYKRGRLFESIRHSLSTVYFRREQEDRLFYVVIVDMLSRMLFERGGKPRRHEYALVFVVNTNAECSLPKIITRGRCCDFRPLLPRLS